LLYTLLSLYVFESPVVGGRGDAKRHVPAAMKEKGHQSGASNIVIIEKKRKCVSKDLLLLVRHS